MARIVRHDATGPMEVKPSEKSVWVCMCGLSKNAPFCDGSHKAARSGEAAGKMYRYVKGVGAEIDAVECDGYGC